MSAGPVILTGIQNKYVTLILIIHSSKWCFMCQLDRSLPTSSIFTSIMCCSVYVTLYFWLINSQSSPLSLSVVISTLRWQVLPPPPPLLPPSFFLSDTHLCLYMKWRMTDRLATGNTYHSLPPSQLLKPFKSVRMGGGRDAGRHTGVLSPPNTCTCSIVPFKASSLHK